MNCLSLLCTLRGFYEVLAWHEIMGDLAGSMNFIWFNVSFVKNLQVKMRKSHVLRELFADTDHFYLVYLWSPYLTLYVKAI